MRNARHDLWNGNRMSAAASRMVPALTFTYPRGAPWVLPETHCARNYNTPTYQEQYRHMRLYLAKRIIRWGPSSSYVSFVIQESQKGDRQDIIDPPIHAEWRRSGGAMILT